MPRVAEKKMTKAMENKVKKARGLPTEILTRAITQQVISMMVKKINEDYKVYSRDDGEEKTVEELVEEFGLMEIKEDKEVEKKVRRKTVIEESEKCVAKTGKGDRCSRKASDGEYCKTHKKQVDDPDKTVKRYDDDSDTGHESDESEVDTSPLDEELCHYRFLRKNKKTGIKKGQQCDKEKKEGEDYCKHHLDTVKKRESESDGEKTSDGEEKVTKRRGRPSKAMIAARNAADKEKLESDSEEEVKVVKKSRGRPSKASKAAKEAAEKKEAKVAEESVKEVTFEEEEEEQEEEVVVKYHVMSIGGRKLHVNEEGEIFEKEGDEYTKVGQKDSETGEYKLDDDDEGDQTEDEKEEDDDEEFEM